MNNGLNGLNLVQMWVLESIYNTAAAVLNTIVYWWIKVPKTQIFYEAMGMTPFFGLIRLSMLSREPWTVFFSN